MPKNIANETQEERATRVWGLVERKADGFLARADVEGTMSGIFTAAAQSEQYKAKYGPNILKTFENIGKRTAKRAQTLTAQAEAIVEVAAEQLGITLQQEATAEE